MTDIVTTYGSLIVAKDVSIIIEKYSQVVSENGDFFIAKECITFFLTLIVPVDPQNILYSNNKRQRVTV